MFQAALVAAHHNPNLTSFADRLRKAGKPHKFVITAVARKLVTIANALYKIRQKWVATAPREIQLLINAILGLFGIARQFSEDSCKAGGKLALPITIICGI